MDKPDQFRFTIYSGMCMYALMCKLAAGWRKHGKSCPCRTPLDCLLAPDLAGVIRFINQFSTLASARSMGQKNMSHRSRSAIFFILASFAVAGSVGAQQPASEDAGEAKLAQPPAKPPQPEKTASAGDSSTSGLQQPVSSAQQPASTPQPPANDSKTAASGSQSLPTIHVNGGASADILRSARDAGFTVKIANGKTHFCKTEAPIGTRFSSEHCINEEQLTLYLSRTQDQRDQLTHILGAPAVTN